MKYQFRQLLDLATQMRKLQHRLEKADKDRDFISAANIKAEMRPVGAKIDTLLPQCEAVIKAEQTKMF
jgi:hypothetical protein